MINVWIFASKPWSGPAKTSQNYIMPRDRFHQSCATTTIMSRFSALLPLLDICNDCQFWQKTASFAGRWEREVQGVQDSVWRLQGPHRLQGLWRTFPVCRHRASHFPRVHRIPGAAWFYRLINGVEGAASGTAYSSMAGEAGYRVWSRLGSDTCFLTSPLLPMNGLLRA